MKKGIIIIVVLLALFVGAVEWSKSLQSENPNIISTAGVHWHPTLEIFVGGELIKIPQNIGLGSIHNPIHTHDDLPTIHLEFDGVVRKEDIKLKKFFTVWGQDLESLGVNVSMTVNGEANELFGEYEMRDGDQIELRYE